MDEKPKKTWRRWFQFRLSTSLVLVAILCWAMAQRPYYETQTETLIVKWTAPPSSGRIKVFNGCGPPGNRYDTVRHLEFNAGLKLPALALVAFIGWKALWLIREHCGRSTLT